MSTTDIDLESRKKFLHEATKLAIESVEKGWGGPFGAVIVKDGEIIGRGQNRVLLTGIPVYHAEVTAIIDACGRINSKALLGSDYHEGNLKMIPRPEGSPDPVPERAQMLKGCELYVNGALPDVHERDLLGADRPRVLRHAPRGHEQDRLRR